MSSAIATSDRWTLHIGFIKLYIVGPGEDAWCACSKSYYSGPVGSERERAIAGRAVSILDREHRYNSSAGPELIQEVLKRAAREIRNGIPEFIPAAPAKPSPPLRAVPADDTPKPPLSDLLAIVAIVARETCIPAPVLCATRRMTSEVSAARSQTYGAIKFAFPGITNLWIANEMGRDNSTISSAVIRHETRLRDKPSYARQFARILAALNSNSVPA